jgi:hypothetical protein
VESDMNIKLFVFIYMAFFSLSVLANDINIYKDGPYPVGIGQLELSNKNELNYVKDDNLLNDLLIALIDARNSNYEPMKVEFAMEMLRKSINQNALPTNILNDLFSSITEFFSTSGINLLETFVSTAINLIADFLRFSPNVNCRPGSPNYPECLQ